MAADSPIPRNARTTASHQRTPMRCLQKLVPLPIPFKHAKSLGRTSPSSMSGGRAIRPS